MGPPSLVPISQPTLPRSALTSSILSISKIHNAMIPRKHLKNGNSKVLRGSFPKLNNNYECKIVTLKIIDSNLKISHCLFQSEWYFAKKTACYRFFMLLHSILWPRVREWSRNPFFLFLCKLSDPLTVRALLALLADYLNTSCGFL